MSCRRGTRTLRVKSIRSEFGIGYCDLYLSCSLILLDVAPVNCYFRSLCVWRVGPRACPDECRTTDTTRRADWRRRGCLGAGSGAPGPVQVGVGESGSVRIIRPSVCPKTRPGGSAWTLDSDQCVCVPNKLDTHLATAPLAVAPPRPRDPSRPLARRDPSRPSRDPLATPCDPLQRQMV